jgi:hypothetical protein
MSILQTPAVPGDGRSTASIPFAAFLKRLGLSVAGKSRGFRLQVILFVALVAISTIPIILLATWAQTNALKKEINSVTEKHLLIARYLSGALERYVADIERAFWSPSPKWAPKTSESISTGT